MIDSHALKSDLYKQHKRIKSPFNYMGSKYKLLSQIQPIFPTNIHCFVDLFCGGGSVGMNADCQKVILNDKSKELMELYKFFKQTPLLKILDQIDKIICDFSLSQSALYGYQYYNCDSSQGLSKYNKQGFLKLREAYNDDKDTAKLFVLLIFSFNNQMRFNNDGDFNVPCGKRDFNHKMRNKLSSFIITLQRQNICFCNKDFKEFKINLFDSKSFFYIDPPYLLACAGYNENNAWSIQEELELYAFMEKLDSRKIFFAFSNVIEHKGKQHTLLQEWLKKTKFITHRLDFHYRNCNYQTMQDKTLEVLITNY